MDEPEDEVVRVDKYNIIVNNITVRATEGQEQRIRDLTLEQRQNFARIMGGDKR